MCGGRLISHGHVTSADWLYVEEQPCQQVISRNGWLKLVAILVCPAGADFARHGGPRPHDEAPAGGRGVWQDCRGGAGPHGGCRLWLARSPYGSHRGDPSLLGSTVQCLSPPL